MGYALKITLNTNKGEVALHDSGYSSKEDAVKALEKIVELVNDNKDNKKDKVITAPSGNVAFKRSEFSSIMCYEDQNIEGPDIF